MGKQRTAPAMDRVAKEETLNTMSKISYPVLILISSD